MVNSHSTTLYTIFHHVDPRPSTPHRQTHVWLNPPTDMTRIIRSLSKRRARFSSHPTDSPPRLHLKMQSPAPMIIVPECEKESVNRSRRPHDEKRSCMQRLADDDYDDMPFDMCCMSVVSEVLCQWWRSLSSFLSRCVKRNEEVSHRSASYLSQFR